MPFFDHLDELRNRVIKSILAMIAGSCIFYTCIDQILSFIIKPVGKLIFTSPADAFLARLNLTIFGGTFLALPVILYQIWKFIACGLKEHEKKYISRLIPFSLCLFVMGGLFAYFIAIPISMRFFLGFSSNLIVPMITINNYISYVGSLLLAFGIIFEFPLILMFLAKIGIATPTFLIQKRRYAIVIIFIISAILTPPDVFSQLIMAIPLIILYEIGILACKITYREKEVSH